MYGSYPKPRWYRFASGGDGGRAKRQELLVNFTSGLRAIAERKAVAKSDDTPGLPLLGPEELMLGPDD